MALRPETHINSKRLISLSVSFVFDESLIARALYMLMVVMCGADDPDPETSKGLDLSHDHDDVRDRIFTVYLSAYAYSMLHFIR